MTLLPTPAALDALVEALDLKALPRTGWVREGVRRPESVAAHSWGVAWLALVLLPNHLDRGRALAYAALHDFPEVRVGDLTPQDGVSKADKHERESEALAGLTADLPPHISALWHAYEAQEDPEARFVCELDRLDMALQALAYVRLGATGMYAFVESAARDVRDPALSPWIAAIRAAWPV